jgi:hypothetical protein
MDYMTRKIETCIYIQRQSRYHRVSTNVTRLARLSAKSMECLLGCHAARRFWLALEDTTYPHPHLLLLVTC